MKYAIGIDIGGTNTKLGIVDLNGSVLKHSTFKTCSHSNAETYINELVFSIENLVDNFDNCVGIGIGAPNSNYYTGTINRPPNLPFGESLPLVDILKKRLSIYSIFLTNDANAAALGEKIYGGGKNLKDFIVITLGTGLGSGIICNGKLLLGADGNAGELGHVCAVVNGRKCGCGKQGCLETYASATGIKRTFLEMVAKYNGKTTLANIKWDNLDARVIEDAARAGDQVAIETYLITGNILGRCLADFVHFSRPSTIFLFGGPVKSGDLIFEPTKKALEKNLMPIFKNKIKLSPSELSESDAAILGAAAMAWDNV